MNHDVFGVLCIQQNWEKKTLEGSAKNACFVSSIGQRRQDILLFARVLRDLTKVSETEKSAEFLREASINNFILYIHIRIDVHNGAFNVNGNLH